MVDYIIWERAEKVLDKGRNETDEEATEGLEEVWQVLERRFLWCDWRFRWLWGDWCWGVTVAVFIVHAGRGLGLDAGDVVTYIGVYWLSWLRDAGVGHWVKDVTVGDFGLDIWDVWTEVNWWLWREGLWPAITFPISPIAPRDVDLDAWEIETEVDFGFWRSGRGIAVAFGVLDHAWGDGDLDARDVGAEILLDVDLDFDFYVGVIGTYRGGEREKASKNEKYGRAKARYTVHT